MSGCGLQSAGLPRCQVSGSKHLWCIQAAPDRDPDEPQCMRRLVLHRAQLFGVCAGRLQLDTGCEAAIWRHVVAHLDGQPLGVVDLWLLSTHANGRLWCQNRLPKRQRQLECRRAALNASPFRFTAGAGSRVRSMLMRRRPSAAAHAGRARCDAGQAACRCPRGRARPGQAARR